MASLEKLIDRVTLDFKKEFGVEPSETTVLELVRRAIKSARKKDNESIRKGN